MLPLALPHAHPPATDSPTQLRRPTRPAACAQPCACPGLQHWLSQLHCARGRAAPRRYLGRSCGHDVLRAAQVRVHEGPRAWVEGRVHHHGGHPGAAAAGAPRSSCCRGAALARRGRGQPTPTGPPAPAHCRQQRQCGAERCQRARGQNRMKIDSQVHTLLFVKPCRPNHDVAGSTAVRAVPRVPGGPGSAAAHAAGPAGAAAPLPQHPRVPGGCTAECTAACRAHQAAARCRRACPKTALAAPSATPLLLRRARSSWPSTACACPMACPRSAWTT